MIDGMDFEEFDQHVQALRARAAGSGSEEGEDFTVIEGLTATAEDTAAAEQALGATLPEQYKAFMRRYGGGQFGFLDLLPIPTPGYA
ncbi:SMI1/KNR4 family protein [Micromonospora aurantiaca (nom. illeg.)]|uniref:SMI1/KNR4 family protein n=1 Tax=Micromonospora aurantiaca (nom. illeg.) TaxID=47850 RepID=UPI0035AFE3B2